MNRRWVQKVNGKVDCMRLRNHLEKGNLSINLVDVNNEWNNFSIVIPECSTTDFMTAVERVAFNKSGTTKATQVNWNLVAGAKPDDSNKQDTTKTGTKEENLNFNSLNLSEESRRATGAESQMSDFTKSELQAHLNANKAEVNAVASSMKKDMAEWREQMRSDLRDVTDAINKQNSTLDKHFHAQQVKLESSLDLQASKFQLSLADAKLDIIKWALGLPSLAFVIYKIFSLLTHN